MRPSFGKNGLIVGIILLFLGVIITLQSQGTLTNESDHSEFKGIILYVGGSDIGNYSSIQEAIDNASDGDTVFVYNDSSPYYENVKVNKSLNLIGEDKDTTVINGIKFRDVVHISADEVNISGFTIRNNGDYNGIKISSNFNTIIDNSISNNGDGIEIFCSYFNTIKGNTISSNNNNGIYLYISNYNTIRDNIITSNNKYGIKIKWSRFNIIIKNNIINNEQDAYFINNHFLFLYRNRWRRNYWNEPQILPKLIIGEVFRTQFPESEIIIIPWIQFDWRPAKEPYDI